MITEDDSRFHEATADDPAWAETRSTKPCCIKRSRYSRTVAPKRRRTYTMSMP